MTSLFSASILKAEAIKGTGDLPTTPSHSKKIAHTMQIAFALTFYRSRNYRLFLNEQAFVDDFFCAVPPII
jgi:hypothetical protein